MAVAGRSVAPRIRNTLRDPIEERCRASIHPPGHHSVDPRRLLHCTDVLDDRFAPSIDVRPLAVADAILIAGHVVPLSWIENSTSSELVPFAGSFCPCRVLPPNPSPFPMRHSRFRTLAFFGSALLRACYDALLR